MAHNLMANDTMFSGSRLTPWHGLGTVIEGRANAQQALQLAKLDWEVENRPVYTADMTEIPGYRALTRTDSGEALGIVWKTYTALQNRTLAEIAETVVSTGEAAFETGGSLFNGRLIWFLLKIGERQLSNGELHKNYLLASNGHAGKARVRFGLVNTRVVCWNTFSAATSESGAAFAVSHTKNLMPRIEAGMKVMKWAHEGTEALFRGYEMLLDKAMSVDAANRVLREHILADRASDATVDTILDLYREGAGNSGKTAFDLFNGITDWLDHREVGDVKAAERRMEKSVMGEDAKLKRHAMEVLMHA